MPILYLSGGPIYMLSPTRQIFALMQKIYNGGQKYKRVAFKGFLALWAIVQLSRAGSRASSNPLTTASECIGAEDFPFKRRATSSLIA